MWAQVGITFRAEYIEKFRDEIAVVWRSLKCDCLGQVVAQSPPSLLKAAFGFSRTPQLCTCNPQDGVAKSWPHFTGEDTEAVRFVPDSEFHFHPHFGPLYSGWRPECKYGLCSNSLLHCRHISELSKLLSLCSWFFFFKWQIDWKQ